MVYAGSLWITMAQDGLGMVLGGHNGFGWFRLVMIGSQGLRMV
jgi:hypothetical protein